MNRTIHSSHRDIVVIGIENEYEVDQYVSEDLNAIFEMAMSGDEDTERDILYLRTLWDNESWKSIQEKFMTEGSAWVVWHNDGISQHYHNLDKAGLIVRVPSHVASMILSPMMPLLV